MTDRDHNNSARDVVHPENMDLLIAEYNALREEVLKRTELKYQLVALTLTASGIILTVGLQTKNASILLVYPILTLFLAVTWASNHLSVVGMGTYIREHIEPRAAENAMGWEHYLPQTRTRFQKVIGVGSNAIFIITELIAILTGLSIATFNAIEKILLTLDVLSIILSTILFIFVSRYSGKITLGLNAPLKPHKDK